LLSAYFYSKQCVYKYENYIYNYTYTYLFFILWVEFHIAQMQTKFCRSFLHHVKHNAGLLEKVSAPRSSLPDVAGTWDSIFVFVIILTINSNNILGLYNWDIVVSL